MRHALIFAALLAGLALPASAATRNCTTALVNATLCGATDHVLLSYSVPPAAAPRLVAALSALANYQDTVPCSAARVVDDGGLIVQAGPGDGTCSAGTLGQQVANPQTRAAVADRFLLLTLRRMIAQHETAQAREAVPESAEPDIPVNGNGGGE